MLEGSMKGLLSFSTMILLLLAASPAGGQTFSDNFDDAPKGWNFQNFVFSNGWGIDSSPAVFTSPLKTMNNADVTVGLFVNGSGSAYSPTLAITPGPHTIKITFNCRYYISEDLAKFARQLNIGTSLPGGNTHASFIFDSPDSTNDDVTPGADEFVVDCPAGGDWHKHTIEVPAAGPEIIVDGVTRGNSASALAAVLSVSSLNVDFFFRWDKVTVPPAGDNYGTIVWVIDDYMIESTTAGGGSGGEGGSSGFCFVAAPIPGIGNGPTGSLMATAILALLALVRWGPAQILKIFSQNL